MVGEKVCDKEVIGPLWQAPIVDYQSEIVNLMREKVRPEWKEGKKSEMGHLQGSENLYNYLSKSLKEKYIRNVAY